MSPVRSQPSSVEHPGRRLRVVPVALEHVGPAHPDLARVADEHVVAVVVDQAHLDAGDDLPDRARAGLDAGRAGDDRRRLGQPVALGEREAEALLAAPGHVRRQRGGAATWRCGPTAKRRPARSSKCAKATHIGGAPGTTVTPRSRMVSTRGRRVEALHEHERGAHVSVEPSTTLSPKMWNSGSTPNTTSSPVEPVAGGAHLVDVGQQVAVAEHRRPRRAGGAAREHHHGQVSPSTSTMGGGPAAEQLIEHPAPSGRRPRWRRSCSTDGTAVGLDLRPCGRGRRPDDDGDRPDDGELALRTPVPGWTG